MAKKTYKTETYTTTHEGEIVNVKKWYSKTEDIHEFIKLMINEVNTLLKLSQGEYQVLFFSIVEMRYESLIIANKAFREKIAKITGKKQTSISAILTSLCQKGIIHRMQKGQYELNPKLFWKGDEGQRLKRVEYHKTIELERKNGKKI